MNRAGRALRGGGARIPRASGDEPSILAAAQAAGVYSPRERG